MAVWTCCGTFRWDVCPDGRWDWRGRGRCRKRAAPRRGAGGAVCGGTRGGVIPVATVGRRPPWSGISVRATGAWQRSPSPPGGCLPGLACPVPIHGLVALAGPLPCAPVAPGGWCLAALQHQIPTARRLPSRSNYLSHGRPGPGYLGDRQSACRATVSASDPGVVPRSSAVTRASHVVVGCRRWCATPGRLRTSGAVSRRRRGTERASGCPT